MPQPFRFALNPFGAPSLQAWMEMARKAEDQGYSVLSVADHTFTPLAPLTSLSLLIPVTSSLRLGTFVLGNDFWHPAVLAREAANIDFLSGGRLELGLGTGWRKSDYEERGLTLDPSGVRIERLEESIHLMKRLFTGEPQSFRGKYYKTEGFALHPVPAQRPHPPLMLGGGARRMLSLAAREADIVSFNVRTTSAGGLDFSSLSAEATRQKVEWIRAAAGDRFEHLELNYPTLLLRVTGDREGAVADFLKQWGPVAAGINPDDILQSPHVLVGSVEQIVDHMHMSRELYGLSYLTVMGGESVRDDFAPVVARLAGT